MFVTPDDLIKLAVADGHWQCHRPQREIHNKSAGLAVLRQRRFKRAGLHYAEWGTRGTSAQHDQLAAALLADPDVRELRY